MNIREIFRRLRNEDRPSQGLTEVERNISSQRDFNMPAENRQSQKYLQWYEENPERFALEIEKVKNEFPDFQAIKLDDGCICFFGMLEGISVSFICDHIYPKMPPKAFLLDDMKSDTKVIDENGEINYFSAGGLRWEANQSFVVDVIKRIQMIFRLCLNKEHQQ